MSDPQVYVHHDKPTSGTAGAVPQGTTPGPEAEAAFAPIDAKLKAIKRLANSRKVP